MVTIQEREIQSIMLNAPKEFHATLSLGQTGVQLKYLPDPSDSNLLYVVVEPNVHVDRLTDSFNINFSVAVPFSLTPKSGITALDLYSCIEKTLERMQRILNAVYDNQRNLPVVAPIEFDIVSPVVLHLPFKVY